MQHKKAKERVQRILEIEIKFEGHFDKCFDNLKESQQLSLIEWIENCKETKLNPIASFKDKQLIGFILRIGSNLRAILTKEKNKYFLVLFLDKHKYYEAELLKLGF